MSAPITAWQAHALLAAETYSPSHLDGRQRSTALAFYFATLADLQEQASCRLSKVGPQGNAICGGGLDVTHTYVAGAGAIL